jgi:segregation and condensation protein A
MGLLTSGQSWEQIIYQIIAWEGLDPWDLNLEALADSFVAYIEKMKEIDFKIPAKFIIVAAVLLKMKAEHLSFLNPQGEEMEFGEELELQEKPGPLMINPITVPPHRQVNRKIMVTELIASLRKVLRMDEKRQMLTAKAREKIVIRHDKLSERIAALYKRIGDILSRIKRQEVEFSRVVSKWERKEVVDTFLPLIFLDHERKVSCRQEEMFDEIYIKKL